MHEKTFTMGFVEGDGISCRERSESTGKKLFLREPLYKNCSLGNPTVEAFVINFGPVPSYKTDKQFFCLFCGGW